MMIRTGRHWLRREDIRRVHIEGEGDLRRAEVLLSYPWVPQVDILTLTGAEVEALERVLWMPEPPGGPAGGWWPAHSLWGAAPWGSAPPYRNPDGDPLL